MTANSSATIMLVEDNEISRELMELILASDGYKVLLAACGEEALALAAKQSPDLILLDIMMPGIDGFEVTRRLKADPCSSNIPIIQITLLDDRESRLKGLQAGAEEFLTKPVEYLELLARIKNMLKIKALNNLLADHNRILEEQVATRSSELRKSEARCHSIIEAITDCRWTVRIENGHTVETMQGAAATGYTAEEFSANPRLWIEMVVPEDRSMVEELVEKIMTGNDVAPIEHRITGNDGQVRWVSNTTIPFRDTSGKLLSYDCVIKDITERKLTEEKLRDSEQQYRTIIEGSNDMIWTLSPDKKFTFINQQAADITGRSIEDWLGESFAPLVLEEDLPIVYGIHERIMNGEKVRYEVRVRSASGVILTLSVNASPIIKGWQVVGTISFARDITEHVKAEAELKHANRALATLSKVNRTMVHATEENKLLNDICDAIVGQHGYLMAWVGYIHDGESIKIMASCGKGYPVVEQLTFSEDGMRPSVIKSGVTQVCQDIAKDSHCLPSRDKALKYGYASCIFLPLLDQDNAVFGILSVYSNEVNAFSSREILLLEEMSSDMAFGVFSLHVRHECELAHEKVRQQFEQLQENLEDTVRALAAIVEVRDPYTSGHQARVANLAAVIARKMGLPEEQVHAIHLAGVLHDLGKVKVPAEMLSNPGKLDDAEFNIIKIHPQTGYDILKGIGFNWPIAHIVLQHHERMDGSGYPQGLMGEQILLEARIISVADVVEAMYSHRPYRPGLGMDAALGEIIEQRGILYDAQAVDACLAVFSEQNYSFSQANKY